MKAATPKASPYGTVKFRSIDEYHASFVGETRLALDTMRRLIQQAAPDAEEVISYNMPAFKQNKVLVYYAAAKTHLGLYPTTTPIQQFANQLSAYKTSRGAIQFPLNKPLPTALIKKIVRFRVKEDMAKSVNKTGR